MKSFAREMVIQFTKLRKCYRCTDEQEDETKSIKKILFIQLRNLSVNIG